MKSEEAKNILEALALGIHPETGEKIGNVGVLNSPSVIRALFIGMRALDVSAGRKNSLTDALPHAGRPWTCEEEAQLITEFDAGMPVDQLAQEHGRSKGGIAARLVKLGKINERSDMYVREPEHTETCNSSSFAGIDIHGTLDQR